MLQLFLIKTKLPISPLNSADPIKLGLKFATEVFKRDDDTALEQVIGDRELKGDASAPLDSRGSASIPAMGSDGSLACGRAIGICH